MTLPLWLAIPLGLALYLFVGSLLGAYFDKKSARIFLGLDEPIYYRYDHPENNDGSVMFAYALLWPFVIPIQLGIQLVVGTESDKKGNNK